MRGRRKRSWKGRIKHLCFLKFDLCANTQEIGRQGSWLCLDFGSCCFFRWWLCKWIHNVKHIPTHGPLLFSSHQVAICLSVFPQSLWGVYFRYFNTRESFDQNGGGCGPEAHILASGKCSARRIPEHLLLAERPLLLLQDGPSITWPLSGSHYVPSVYQTL